VTTPTVGQWVKLVDTEVQREPFVMGPYLGTDRWGDWLIDWPDDPHPEDGWDADPIEGLAWVHCTPEEVAAEQLRRGATL
jgi:hypothetical protein